MKKVLSVFFCLILSTGVLLADNHIGGGKTPPPPKKEQPGKGGPEKKPPGPGMKMTEEMYRIAFFQTSLAMLEEYQGPISGMLNELTIEALKHFQVEAGIPETGKPDELTFETLLKELDKL